MSAIDLSTEYMGLKLKSPLVPSASPLSRSLDTAKKLEDAGAGAIVMYSLFEEELLHEELTAAQFLIHQDIGHGEADSFLPLHDQYQHNLEQYLEQLAQLKESLDIPIIASLNGISMGGWVEHGRLLEDFGADGLELNVYYLSADFNESSFDIERRYLMLLAELKNQVSIPIAMKLSPYFSALPHFIKQLENYGADAVVLFNRFFQPDIDLDELKVNSQLQFSTSVESQLALRWIALLYGRIQTNIAASGGLHSHEDVLKMLLAGADITQLCAVLLQYGPEHLGKIQQQMLGWLEQHEFDSIKQIKGELSQQHCSNPEVFERSNYVSLLTTEFDALGPSRS